MVEWSPLYTGLYSNKVEILIWPAKPCKFKGLNKEVFKSMILKGAASDDSASAGVIKNKLSFMSLFLMQGSP